MKNLIAIVLSPAATAMRKRSIFLTRVAALLLALCPLAQVANAQDAAFTNFYAAPLYLNPALAGSSHGQRIAFNFRQQWNRVPIQMQTMHASYDAPISSSGINMGVNVFQTTQGAGLLKKVGGNLTVSTDVRLTKKATGRLGIQFGGAERSVKWDRFLFGDQIDPVLGITNPRAGGASSFAMNLGTKRYADVSAGGTVEGSSWQAGAAAHHAGRPRDGLFENESRLPIRWTLHGGKEFEADRVFKNAGKRTFMYVNMMGVYQAQRMNFVLGASFKTDYYNVGLWTRDMNSVGVSLIFEGLDPRNRNNTASNGIGATLGFGVDGRVGQRKTDATNLGMSEEMHAAMLLPAYWIKGSGTGAGGNKGGRGGAGGGRGRAGSGKRNSRVKCPQFQ